MNAIEAYDHACATFGAEAGVLCLGERRIVGRWTPISALHGADLFIMRTSRNALVVLGEGDSWVDAFMAAEKWRREVMT